MTWSQFSAIVSDLLGPELGRLGAQVFIARQIRLAIGDIQRQLDYYRRGHVTTLDVDDVSLSGYASIATLPAGASIRELYHVKTGSGATVRRPLTSYEFSNRGDLVAGVVRFGSASSGAFFYSLDPRGGRDITVYPRLTEGTRSKWCGIP